MVPGGELAPSVQVDWTNSYVLLENPKRIPGARSSACYYRTWISKTALTVTVSANGVRSGLLSIADNDWRDYRIPLPRVSARMLAIRITVSRVWVPNSDLGNGDPRRLGVQVNRMWVERNMDGT